MRMPKQEPLVIQHLEKISRAGLEQYEAILRDHVRGKQGVYALYCRDKLCYVGLASNLRNRLNTHLKDHLGKRWDRFSIYLTKGDQHLKELESLVLRIVRPSGNKVVGKFAKSENLLRHFARRAREQALRELDEVLGRHRPRLRIRRGGKTREARNHPDLQGCFPRAVTLRGWYLGQEFTARVRKNGTIRFGNKIYLSVSAAARAARGRGTNGWSFWHVKHTTKGWQRLRDCVAR
jgi:hypothetical protein